MTAENSENKEVEVKEEEEKQNPVLKFIKKLRGVGYTRKNKEQTKKARKLAKLMRKTNRARNKNK